MYLIAVLIFNQIAAFGETEPNNTLQQANTLAYNGSQSGSLTGTDTEDWFVVDLPAGGIFTLTTHKTGAGYANIYLLDGEKTGNPEIGGTALSYGNSPAEGWSVVVPLLSGRYYVKVRKSADPVDYQISASLKPPAFPEDTEPNDSLAQAALMSTSGITTGTLHYYDAGKGTDQVDWYKLTIPKGGILTLKIHKRGPGNSWLRFLDGAKKELPEVSNYYFGFSETGTQGDTWSFPVLAGSYYVKIEGGGNVVDYRLESSLTDPSFPEDAEPNDSITYAIRMDENGTVSGNVHYYNPGKGYDWIDWYRIDITKGGILNLKIHKKGPGNSWIHFLDGVKKELPEISNYYFGYAETSAEGDKWSFPVLKGTYYLKMEGGGGILDYKLEASLAAPAFPEDTEPNDTITRALVMSENGTVSGNVHYYNPGKGYDLIDWYRIDITKGGILKLKIHKRGPGNTWFRFLDGAKKGLPEISNFYFDYSVTPDEGKQWSFPVLAGTYYFRMEGGGNVVDYKMEATLVDPAYPEDTESNDSLSKATVIPVNGTVSGNLHYYNPGKDYDWDDWYKMDIPHGGILSLTIFKKGPGNSWIRFRDAIKSGNPEISNFYFDYNETQEKGLSWSYPVLKGLYYFQISGGSHVLDYKIDIRLIPPLWGEDQEPNDSIHLAVKKNLNDTINGLLGYYKPGLGIDDWDWFTLEAKENGYLSFQVEKKGIQNGNVRLRDSTSEIGGQYLEFGDFGARFGKQVSKGRFYLGFQKYGGDIQYRVIGKLMPKPAADFSWIQMNNSLTFENKTIDGENFSWDFDDGSTSAAVHPMHEYLKPGNYDITLIAKNIAGSDTITHRVVIPGLDRIYPNSAGNSGDATLQVFGGGLDTLFRIRLEQNGMVKASSGPTAFGGKSGISATFDLRNMPTGTYDVAVEKKSGPSYRIPGGFTVVQGNKAQPWARLEGRNRILFNTVTTYKIVYGNNGNVDASGVPIWIAVSDLPGLTVEFSGITIRIPDYVYEKKLMDAYEAVDYFFTTDSVLGKPFRARVYPFYIPVIPAGTTNQVTLKIKTAQNVRVMVWVNDPYFESPMKGSFAACVASVFAEGIIDAGTAAIPAVGCITQGLKSVYTLFSPFPGQPEKGNTWGSWLKGFAVSLVDCGISLTGVGAVVKAMGVLLANSYLYKEKLDDCRKAFMVNNPNDQEIAAVASLDPNEKTGPTGYGAKNYIAYSRNFPYTIYFENKATATAPAHTILVSDQLDVAKFDLASFSFGDVTIGDSLIRITKGLREFSADMKLDKLNITARITGKLDTETGKVDWTIRSLDPVTLDDIEDSDRGLLPPNLNPPQGEGSVSFYVRLKEYPEHNSEVTNQASIVFDANPAIITNKHLTTFDLKAPESAVQLLAATTAARQFTVRWAGTDDGSGIENYLIYVRKNNGPYQIWLAGTTETTAQYQSADDGMYQFSSVAVDKTGNREVLAETPDATTQVVTHSENQAVHEGDVLVTPVPSSGCLIADIGIPGNFSFRIFGTDGRLRMEKKMSGQSVVRIPVNSLSRGLYLWQLVSDDSQAMKKGKFVVSGK